MSDDIYSYFKKKTREKNIKIKDIVNKSGVSRTTVYRMIKGIVKPSDEVYNTIVEVLELNKDEIAELNKYIDLIDFSCTEIKARQAIAELLYDDPYNNVDDSSLEMIVYKDNHRYVKNFDEIINEIMNYSDKENFNLNFKIVNCVDSRIISTLKNAATVFCNLENPSFFEEIENKALNIEHLISFHRDLYDKNIKILDLISNMLIYNNYNLFFPKENISDTAYFNIENKNIILATYNYIEDNREVSKSLTIVFSEEDYSDCLIINDRDTFNFFHNLFKKTKESFKLAVYEGSDFSELNFLLSEFEKDSELCSFNPNPAYRRIPSIIYEELMSNEKNKFIDLFRFSTHNENLTDYSIKSEMQEFLQEVNIANNLSRFNKVIDVFTTNSLNKFAAFGMISNHPPGMVAFTVENRIKILETILEKSKDKNRQYEYMIVDKPLQHDKLSFTSSENKLLIENTSDKIVVKRFNYRICIIEDESIAKSFLDFAENYLPRNLAMNKKKAEQFLLDLIQNLKDSTDTE